MSKKYLVTGGAGFIGTNLVWALHNKGHRVVVVDDLSAGDRKRLPEEVEFHQNDICDTDALTALCKAVDVVVHLAALPRVQFSIEHPFETQRVNMTGTLSVLEAARMAGVRRVVFAGSSAVYGDHEEMPLREDLPPRPKSPYALHKLMGEHTMRLWHELHGIETVTLRFFNVYGPHMDPEGAYALVVGKFLKLRQEGKPLTICGDGSHTRDFVHVSDVAQALIAAAERQSVGNGEVINIGSGESTSVGTLAQLIGGEVDYQPPRIEPKHTRADTTEAQALLDWVPRKSLNEAIAELKEEFGITA